MDQNARHGVEYLFAETRHELTGTMLLGVPGQSFKRVTMLEAQTGAVQERPSFLHLAAARGFQLLPDATKTEGKGHVFGLGHDEAHEDAMLAEPWFGDRSLIERSQASGVAAELLAFAADKSDDIAGGFGVLGRKYIDGLHQTIRDHAKAADMKPQALTKRLAACWRSQEKQLRYAIHWTEELLGKRPLPERLMPATRGDAERKSVLENAWREAIPPPRGNEPPNIVKLASELEEKLIRWGLG
jgi:hypothetical protein